MITALALSAALQGAPTTGSGQPVLSNYPGEPLTLAPMPTTPGSPCARKPGCVVVRGPVPYAQAWPESALRLPPLDFPSASTINQPMDGLTTINMVPIATEKTVILPDTAPFAIGVGGPMIANISYNGPVTFYGTSGMCHAARIAATIMGSTSAALGNGDVDIVLDGRTLHCPADRSPPTWTPPKAVCEVAREGDAAACAGVKP